MKNSLLVRFFVLASVVFGVQPEIFSGSSSVSQKQSTAQRAKGYLMNLFSLKSSRSNAVVPLSSDNALAAKSVESQRVLARTTSSRRFSMPAPQPQPAVRTESFSDAMKSRKPASGLASHESALKYLPKLPKEKGLSIADSSKIDTSRFNKTSAELREAALKAVPPRPVLPALPSQPKRPVRQQ